MERLCIILVVIATVSLFVKDILGTEYNNFLIWKYNIYILRKLGKS